jgi:hypothetical protein
MNGPFSLILYEISIWAIPAVIAITFHEASHGYVAHVLGDDTAWRLGRVSFNPLVHIDPFGTVLLPVLLLLLRAPFLFGYAKPVPVNFRALRHPRMGTILVAAAESAFGDDRRARLSYRWLHSRSRGTVVGRQPKERSPAQRRSGDIQSFADSAPRWRTHPGWYPSWRVSSLAVPPRALWLADTHQSAFRAATAWCATRH